MDCAVIAQPYNHVSITRRKTTWYSIASGNWTDPAIWMSNSHRKYAYPQIYDDVYINHTVTINGAASQVYNLYVSGTLKWDNATRNFFVGGDLQATGTVDLTSVGTSTLFLFGLNNFIVNFIGGASSTVQYQRGGVQPIMPLTYRHLKIDQGARYFIGNVTVNGTFAGGFTNCSLDTTSYNLTVIGTTSLNNVNFTSSGNGSHLFVGAAGFSSSMNISTSPTLEFRGGVTFSGGNQTLGNSTVNFTTNNQTIAGGAQIIMNGVVTVAGAITVTNTGTWSTGNIINNIVGTVAGSTFTNSGNLSFSVNTTLPMASLGVFDYMATATSQLGILYAGNSVLPYSSYARLYINATGIKTIPATTTIADNLLLVSGTLEAGAFDLTLVGTTSVSSNTAFLSKNGSGNIVFIGSASSLNGGKFILNGNPSIECRGGLSINGVDQNLGSGTVTFTTNNQTLTAGAAINTTIANIIISGAITVTTAATSGNLIITGTINGNNAASTFDSRGAVQYQATQQPMLTGVLQTNAAANTFIYNAAGNQDVTGGTYRTLTLAGSGVKTLQGNVVVATAYTLTPPATLNTNGFTRT